MSSLALPIRHPKNLRICSRLAKMLLLNISTPQQTKSVGLDLPRLTHRKILLIPKVLGPSTTQLFRNLSLALWEHLTPGSEIILSKFDHEANVAPWLQMASWRGLTVKWWDAREKHNPKLDCDVLSSLLSQKTRLVACTHTSNVLGSISDIKRIAQVVHSVPGALLCVDAVAYAPHRPIDVKDLEVDFYAFSWYKVSSNG